MTSAIRHAILDAAARHGLTHQLVEAIVETESDGDPHAVRYEPHYRWLTDFSHPMTTSATERNAQKTSGGLMQIMGAVARERGFTAPYLALLCDPHVGLEYGCRHLRWLFDRDYTEMEVISAYNQGTPRRNQDGTFRNQGYVDRVVRLMRGGDPA